MTLVKVCGITNLEDARRCVAAGADMLGFNFYPASKRYISPRAARRIIEQLTSSITYIGVFVNEPNPERVTQLAAEARVSVVQLHGDESAEYCRGVTNYPVIKALRVAHDFAPEQAAAFGAQTVLLDTFHEDAYGGTGQTFDWSSAVALRALVPKLILAGGLTPGNVSAAIAQVRPFAVDACSSLECAPGLKDAALVQAFIAAVREGKSKPTRLGQRKSLTTNSHETTLALKEQKK